MIESPRKRERFVKIMQLPRLLIHKSVDYAFSSSNKISWRPFVFRSEISLINYPSSMCVMTRQDALDKTLSNVQYFLILNGMNAYCAASGGGKEPDTDATYTHVICLPYTRIFSVSCNRNRQPATKLKACRDFVNISGRARWHTHVPNQKTTNMSLRTRNYRQFFSPISLLGNRKARHNAEKVFHFLILLLGIIIKSN